ncbi:class I SAM-dependent methyltransferase [Haloarchaeobius amylolyticus]|uniref:class I SAM-dependent methyltransferase n=1 Tax=Haloarchaeobius amylolyticus TaxID=1198296 RepID=UPI002270B014|nr:class I SAM-dependent methyltransferase [Haloarchaeobius amylolyticus]
MATLATDAERDAFAERLLGAMAGAFDVFAIYIGDTLGFYHALAGDSPLTAAELAAETDTHDRYVREWCEQQTVSGILAVDDPAKPAEERRYSLPPAHVEILTDLESERFLAPFAQLFVGAATPISAVVEAFRTGEGVPREAYGDDYREGQGRLNRPAYLDLLGREWLQALPDVDARLHLEDARVADVCCGHGFAAIGVADTYPTVHVDAFDTDGRAVESARRHVAEFGLVDRVDVQQADVADLTTDEPYDLVLAFECVHELADPVGALSAMRDLAGEHGSVLVMDRRVGDGFGDELEYDWLTYGWSVLHCLPVGLAEQPSAGTGAVMRPDTLRFYADEAGFERVEVLPIEHERYRFYRLYP